MLIAFVDEEQRVTSSTSIKAWGGAALRSVHYDAQAKVAVATRLPESLVGIGGRPTSLIQMRSASNSRLGERLLLRLSLPKADWQLSASYVIHTAISGSHLFSTRQTIV
jgi:hypothetical protein